MRVPTDTICAIVTPPGVGGISVLRLSGRNAIEIAARVFVKKSGKPLKYARSHTLHYGFMVDPSTGEKVDEVMVSLMRAPHTYTCEDIVEVSCHGGPFVTGRILELLLKNGARLAEPGEFTRRAFLNGRIDLTQAEAVIDIISAKSEEGLKCALWQLEGNLSRKINQLYEKIINVIAHMEACIDFPEEDIRIDLENIKEQVLEIIEIIDSLIDGYYTWRPYREGILTALVGRVNAGKSSLLNALLGEERAIVSPLPGTTRDIVDGVLLIHGIPLRILDTAGLREAKDMVEEEGIKRMYRAIDSAELVLLVIDGTGPLTEGDRELLTYTRDKRRIIIINKIDRGVKDLSLPSDNSSVIYVSALTGEGIDTLRNTIQDVLRVTRKRSDPMVANIRHKVALEKARKELKTFLKICEDEQPVEVLALYLREAAHHIGEITGIISTEDILDRIFSNFCIGK